MRIAIHKRSTLRNVRSLSRNVHNFISRTLGKGLYFSEMFLSVIYDARYLIFYIFYSTISAALCLGVLYKDIDVNALTFYQSNLDGRWMEIARRQIFVECSSHWLQPLKWCLVISNRPIFSTRVILGCLFSSFVYFKFS